MKYIASVKHNHIKPIQSASRWQVLIKMKSFLNEEFLLKIKTAQRSDICYYNAKNYFDFDKVI